MDDRAVTRIGKRESGNLQARFGFMTTPCLSVKKGRPNCGGPSEEGKRPAGDDGRSHSKASKPLRCCDTRHRGRHGTRSASRVANASKNRSSKIGSRKLPARDPQEREQACRCNAHQRLHLLVAGLHHLRECTWLPPATTSIKTDGCDTSTKIDGAS